MPLITSTASSVPAARSSVQDHFYLSTDYGRLVLNIMVGAPQPPRAFAFPTAERLVDRHERRLLAAHRAGWSSDEIEQRLRTFTVGRRRFPTPDEFFAAGERRLYEHVMLHGCGPIWASKLKLPFPQGRRRALLPWTEERVRDGLTTFLVDYAVWPTVAQFKAADQERLRCALVRFGGMHRWAEEFQLPVANFQCPAPRLDGRAHRASHPGPDRRQRPMAPKA